MTQGAKDMTREIAACLRGRDVSICKKSKIEEVLLEEVLNRQTLSLAIQHGMQKLFVNAYHYLSRFYYYNHIMSLFEIQTLGRGTRDG